MGAILLTGCTTSTGSGDKPPAAQATSSPLARPELRSEAMRAGDAPVVIDAPAVGGAMGVCLFEAEQLQRMGSAGQKALVTGLYRNIRAAQAYTPMAQKLSPGTASTVTPLYEYAVNDACNSVNQALLSVLKKQVPVSGGGRE